MIRVRSQKLLSGVSGLAVLASFGLVSPALAAATYPGPATYDPITNDQTGVNSTVTIGADATIRANAGTNDSFFNNLNMSGTGTKLTIDDSYLLGDIENSGSVVSSDADGFFIGKDSQIGGRIFNSGTIGGGGGQGIQISDDSTVAGGILNQGAITGTLDGILLSSESEIFNGINNSGVNALISGSSDGIDIQGSGTEFWGGITNSGSIVTSGGGATDAAVEFSSGLFNGGITNTGYIGSPTATGSGISLQSGQFNGNIANNPGGLIEGNTGANAAINISGGTIASNINNSATIRGINGAEGITISGGTITGEIQNNSSGIITVTGANATAILFSGGTISGGIDNNGSILADAASGNAIVISGGLFNGGIENTGLIRADDDTAILISLTTYNGGINNTGTILSVDDDAITITSSVTDFNGDIVNDGTITARFEGIEWDGTNFTGSIVNNGRITAQSTGIRIGGTNFNGSVTNAGRILENGGGDGIEVEAGAIVDGDVTNTSTGTITTDRDGIIIAGTVTGDVVNDGTIIADADASANGEGIQINGLVQGSLINTGLIDPVIGIDVNGEISDGIFNNGGSIIGTQTGIDLSGATAAHTITQPAGLIQGRTANNLTITNALNMTNAHADLFLANGGSLDGNVLVNATDDFIMDPSGTFTWRRGSTTGTLDQFDFTGDGTAVLGATGRGDVTGEGVTVDAANVTFGGEGTVYLDDDTVINATTFSQTDGTIEFFVTSDETQHEYITSGAALTLTNLRGAVYIDPNTMALGGGQTTYDYNDVIDGTGARVGALPNGGTLTTSSIFFTGTFDTTDDADDIDIVLNRLDFDDALAAAGATESQNQQAVAAALEEIYDNVALSPEMESVFIDLFTAGLTPEQIQFILDELGGAEHAQLQQVTVNVANIFNNMVGERLDGSKHSLGGANLAMLERLYADAGTTANDGSHGMTRGRSGTSVWLRGLGQWVNVDADPEADGYDQDTNGLVGGIDHAVNANAMVGGAVAYTDSDVDFDEAGDAAEVESWQVGLYGTYGFGKFYVDGQASYAWNDVNAARTITLPSATYVATSAYDSSAWTLSGELGAIWKLGRVNLQPSVNLAYVAADVDGFSETVTPSAPGLGLVVNGSDADSLATTVAIRASGQWMMGKTTVVPDLKLGWRHEFENDRMSFGANFFEDLSAPAAFTIVSSEIAQDSLVVSTGATFGVSRNFEVFVDLNGLYNSDAASTNASGGVRLTW